MTTYNKATLKTFFETNDIPAGSDYANLIDSQVNIVETATQVMAGALAPTELITARVSATNIIATNSLNVTGTMSAANLVVTGQVSAVFVAIDSLTFFAGAGNNANIATVSSDATYSNRVLTSAIQFPSNIVSAAGTTQGTAAVLVNAINRGRGVADGTTTGFTPPANQAGTVRYLYNEGPSANLWPPVGGTINGLAANAPFPLAASAMVTIVHLTASAMAAK